VIAYAEGTVVPISRSREEIARVLQAWGASQVQWGDDYEAGLVMLRFMWTQKKASGSAPAVGARRFQARIVVKLQSKTEIEKEARASTRSSWRPTPKGKLEKLMAARGKREHRVLLLWLKATFNAIDMGIISAEEIFFPYMEGADGATVAEMAMPHIERLLGAGGAKMLLLPGKAE
jgi:hypothetical protein